ncbi:Putative, 10TM heavy-metal exporter [Loktanella fryxellensis]|uniref:Putative, 10TM heavy-metal exporter n=1 Tax=Loktanella fryxellensis TaxID=245187 RepID=A0A1H7YZH8_9RHOB|nr:putative manganese transporter [Loktanella fryxellensis]SEM51395.1 Putative, 10TM heavy-metal exporter [Loktanella fryxellensis]
MPATSAIATPSGPNSPSDTAQAPGWRRRTIGPFRLPRLIVALSLLALALAPGSLGALTRGLMTDAFVQVSAFVAATLILFYGAERVFRFNIGDTLSNARGWQVPMAALLGVTPGCGGAVMVVAAYSSGHVRFGAVVATLTATMGDAAFLLIATRPDAALVVLPLSFVAGIVSGWIVDALPGHDRPARKVGTGALAPLIGRTRLQDIAYGLFALPGLVIGVTQVMGGDVAAIFGPLLPIVGLGGTAVGLFIWSTSRLQAMTNDRDAPVTRMAEETAFISVWVIWAYLGYDYLVAYGGFDLEAVFSAVGPLLPLMGVLVGLVPGCGPQVLVTTLYVGGVIPFAALMGNAISNDGDALFPAIALDPGAAMRATIYTTVPALILAYGFHWLAPGFMN